ncbi:MAG: D-alanyl-D-alanine carboxypeptidase [Ruminococcus sp.]|nr:D-alanyl-D-alanine carboxypeptidase [Ruminococcus sp.]MCM1381974.1 D-alanyl-D-alanine carboxypeptidase [Muribaculaceae bacterium]MCM1480707.1 D-alanyl-D-alanine carboxypeptidase [Muribaculaceae bacterium]
MRNLTLRRILCAFLAIITLTPLAVSAETDRDYTFCEILMEASGGAVIESVNGDVPVPVGTMAKLMTVLLAAEKVEAGELSLDDKLKTSSYANSMQGAQIWLMPGEEITVDELFKGVIIGNANDASVVLAEETAGSEEKFVSLMNARAGELGMSNTVFTNCNGYYEDEKQISTAEDIAKLCVELAKYDFLKGYFTCWRDFVRCKATELVNANELVKSYKGITGFKAGYTDNSGYCIAVGAERDGVTYISVVLGCDDKDIAFTEAKRLMNAAFSGYTVFVPELPKDIPAEIPVKGGLTSKIPVEYGEVKRVVLPNGAANSVTSKVIVPDYVYAPVEKGSKVGEIHYMRNEKVIFTVDILAAESAEEITVKKAMGILLKKLLTF